MNLNVCKSHIIVQSGQLINQQRWGQHIFRFYMISTVFSWAKDMKRTPATMHTVSHRYGN